MTKQELINKIRPILEKGKAINDIIFVSKKMAFFDIAFMLQMLRVPKSQCINKFKDHNQYGWEDKDLINMVENPVLTGGGDGFEQLLFGCIAALDVYTENEIVTVLETQQQWRGEPNE